jgi:hypothetical protein
VREQITTQLKQYRDELKHVLAIHRDLQQRLNVLATESVKLEGAIAALESLLKSSPSVESHVNGEHVVSVQEGAMDES